MPDPPPPPLGQLLGPEKLKAVTELVDKLCQDLDNVFLFPPQREGSLEELKIYSRDPNNADPIFTEKGMMMLLRHAFHSPSSKTARAALRVLANAMLLNPETRQIFVDKGFAPRACHGLKSDNFDDEFLLSRIIFLLTYGTDVNLEELVDKHNLADHIMDNISRHAREVSKESKSKAPVDPMEDMALGETLKLLFNITHFCPDRVSIFTPAVPNLVPLLWKQDISQSKPLEAPLGPVINALLNLDLEAGMSRAALYPKNEPDKVALRLIEILDPAIKTYRDSELDNVITPLVGVIRKVYDYAPDSTKQRMRKLLLPTAEDRENILGKGNTLSALILKNSTNPMAPAAREHLSHLLFDMSDKDASKFVENVGYGFASGFLYQNNMPVPASASEAFSTRDLSGSQKPVNPVTGQFYDAEKPVDEPEWSEEEKLREAERLFTTFERLKQLGVVKVENPVETAIREGSFRKLKDDEVEELD
ncbi:guanine nucleotide exchange factor synembryn [Fusarium albosuccineum]|uniref:Guanine nucleotide exchange factor synembryn n=1 Tax=Fusarium albosuccineum TaxID=1237068 RepID=A0A8H4LAE0_9HYPO|nr:guanine nucleotide exchange factor synembryn [Fusarium albosuccineum]